VFIHQRESSAEPEQVDATAVGVSTGASAPKKKKKKKDDGAQEKKDKKKHKGEKKAQPPASTSTYNRREEHVYDAPLAMPVPLVPSVASPQSSSESASSSGAGSGSRSDSIESDADDPAQGPSTDNRDEAVFIHQRESSAEPEQVDATAVGVLTGASAPRRRIRRTRSTRTKYRKLTGHLRKSNQTRQQSRRCLMELRRMLRK